MTIQAIIFDFGGVLVSESLVKARLAEFDRMLGWEPGDLHRRLYSGPAWEAVSTGVIDLSTYWSQVGLALEPLLPPDFPTFRDNFCCDVLDPAMVALAWRLRPCYRLALLSNATILAARPPGA